MNLGDIGTIVTFVVQESGAAVNLAAATTKELIFTKPNGETITRTASFTTNGSDGSIFYATVADDIDQVGLWYVRARVVIGAGDWKTDRKSFRVSL